MNTPNQETTLRNSPRWMLALFLALFPLLFAGCKHNEPLRPPGYDFGMRVNTPLDRMAANGHPDPVTLHAVYFGFDSAELTARAKESLRRSAEQIVQHRRPVIVTGHTDFRNTEEYNEDLALERAVTVRDYLWQAGVPKDWIHVRSRGKREPAGTNLTEEGRAKNRRVEIAMQIYGPGRSAEESLLLLNRYRRQNSLVEDSGDTVSLLEMMGLSDGDTR